MTFDIYTLDKLEGYDEEETEDYQDTLHQLFAESPEGQAFAEIKPEMGFWSYQFMYFTHGYIGTTLPQMDLGGADELMLEIFPRKISIGAPEDLEMAVPEISAFWRFLQRAYELPNAAEILDFLQQVEPAFKRAMFDPRNFGMAKSFFMQGQDAGFDMTDEEQINQFMLLQNMSVLSGQEAGLPLPPDIAEMDNLLDLFGAGEQPSKPPTAASRHKARVAKQKKKKQRRRR